ncbi:hypothetical protein STENM327S_09516 [Streptomyces tendae]
MKSSSAVAATTARFTTEPAGRASVARNRRSPSGASEDVAPGDQIQEAPSRDGGAGGSSAPIQLARQPSAGSEVSHQRVSLQGERRPAASQTRTCQW